MTTEAIKPIPRLSGSWLMGSFSQFQDDRLGLLLKVGRECGEIGSFRLGPLSIVMPNSPTIIQKLVVDNGENLFGGRFLEVAKPVLGRTSVALNYTPDHIRLRRLMSPAFQHKRLVGYVEAMGRVTDDFQRKLEDGAQLEVGLEMSQLTREILVNTLFTSKSQEKVEFYESIRIAAEHITDRTSNPMAPPLSWPTPKNRRTRRAIELLRSRAKAIVDEGLTNKGETKDLLSSLLAARDEDGSGFNEEELIDQVLTIYLAGHETTSNATSWLWLLLAQHQDIQQRVHDEVYTALQGRVPGFDDLAQLPYTMQVIKETLRLNPPAAFMSREPLKDLFIEGYKLPKGQFIIASPWVLHRSPQYFPDPERFDPDRFSPENEKKLPRNAYIPFGMGSHVCIGQRFALMELHVIVAHIVQHMHISLLPNQTVVPVPLATVAPSKFFVTVKRRQHTAALAS